jgi:hypothetical protein
MGYNNSMAWEYIALHEDDEEHPPPDSHTDKVAYIRCHQLL